MLLSGWLEDDIATEEVPELPEVGCDLKESLGLLRVAETIDSEVAFAERGVTKNKKTKMKT